MTFKELYNKLTSRLLWGNLLAMGILAIVLIVGLFVFLAFYTHHGETITVPDVTGQKTEVAQRKLENLGLRVEVRDTGYVTSLAPDLILEQHIAPGTQVKVNRLIYLTVNSASARTIPLPNVIDGSLREAQMRLKALGFSLGAVKYIDGDEDLVIRVEVQGREVRAGERLSVERPITLVVGNGNYEDDYSGNDSLDFEMNREYELEELEQQIGNYDD